MTSQETDRDKPTSVWESLAEARVRGGLLQGQGTECSMPAGERVKEVDIIFITST